MSGATGGADAGRAGRVPLVILAGFLGAGKTHFLRALVPALLARGVRTRVILNDLERAAVDAAALRDLQVELAPITGGCLCCETQEELVAALGSTGGQPHDAIVLEANGTTDTALLLETLAIAPGLEHLAAPIQVTTVDATRFGRRGWMNAIEREQAMTSSHLRISKGDLVDEARVGAVRGALTALVPPAIWTDVGALANDVAAAVERAGAPAAEEHQVHAYTAHAQAWAHTAQAHVVHAHAQRHPFVSCQLPLPGTVDGATFETFLRSLPETIVRAKGIVRLREPAGAKRSFQLAAGLAEISPCELLDPDSLEPVAVFVGSGIDAPALGAALARLMADGPPDRG
jgi:G3E family GTPase